MVHLTKERRLFRVIIARSSILVAVAAATVIAGLWSRVAQAEDTSLGFTVSPPLREINVEPGQKLSQTVDFTNVTSNAVTVYPLACDFEPSDDPTTTSPKFTDSCAISSSTALSSWITFGSDSVTVDSRHTVPLSYTISVPTDASPGGHYGGVFISTKQPADTQTSNVGIETRVGSLMLLTVAGDIKASANAIEFTAINKQDKPTWLFEAQPIRLRSTIANTGNVHLQPSGSIVITDIFGHNVLEQTFNETGSRILPASRRTIVQNITDRLNWGRFIATTTIILKAPDGTIVPMTMTTSFWILPLTALAIGFAVLIVLALAYRYWRKRRNRQAKPVTRTQAKE